MKRALISAIAFVTLAFSLPAYALEEPDTTTQVTESIYDVLLMRPLGVIGVGVGVATFIIGLPITLPLGEAGRTAQEFIITPVNYTFTRPIGYMQTEELAEWRREAVRSEAEYWKHRERDPGLRMED